MVIRVLLSGEKTKIIWIGKIIIERYRNMPYWQLLSDATTTNDKFRKIDRGSTQMREGSKNGFSARNGDVGGMGH